MKFFVLTDLMDPLTGLLPDMITSINDLKHRMAVIKSRINFMLMNNFNFSSIHFV